MTTPRTKGTCTIDDCEKSVLALGLCKNHYEMALKIEKQIREHGSLRIAGKNGRLKKGGGPGSNDRGGSYPKIVNDEPTIKRIHDLAGLQCTKKEIAGVLQINDETLRLFFDKYPEAEKAFEEGRLNGRASLRRMQFVMAKRSAAMGIWLGKNYLEQVDSKMIIPAPGHSISDQMGDGEGATALLRAVKTEDE